MIISIVFFLSFVQWMTCLFCVSLVIGFKFDCHSLKLIFFISPSFFPTEKYCTRSLRCDRRPPKVDMFYDGVENRI